MSHKEKYENSHRDTQSGGKLGDMFDNKDIGDEIVIVLNRANEITIPKDNWTDIKDVFKYVKIEKKQLSHILGKNITKLIGFYYKNQYYDDQYTLDYLIKKDILKPEANFRDIIINALRESSVNIYRYVIDDNKQTIILHKGEIYDDTILYTELQASRASKITKSDYVYGEKDVVHGKKEASRYTIVSKDSANAVFAVHKKTKNLVSILYNNNFNKLNGTQVIVYTNHGSSVNHKNIAANKLSVSDLNKLETNSSKRLVVSIHDGGYNFVENHAYVNFANHFIGGGVFNGAFVQEEMLITFSNLYHLINKRKFVSENKLYMLNEEPAVIRIAMLYSQKTKEIYNEIKLIQNKEDSKKHFNDYTDSPINIYFVCMAAVQLAEHTSLNRVQIKHHFNLATMAFSRAIFSISNGKNTEVYIHTGNWGCGAFLHNINMIYLIQYLAILQVSQFYTSVKINYNHHCFVTKVVGSINKNSVRFLNKCANLPISEILDAVSENTEKCTGVAIDDFNLETCDDKYFDGARLKNDAISKSYWYCNWMCHIGTISK